VCDLKFERTLFLPPFLNSIKSEGAVEGAFGQISLAINSGIRVACSHSKGSQGQGWV